MKTISSPKSLLAATNGKKWTASLTGNKLIQKSGVKCASVLLTITISAQIDSANWQTYS